MPWSRLGLVRTVQLGNSLLLPALVALPCCDSKYGALPLLGLVADHHGPHGAFVVLAALPIIAVAVSALLREPASVPPSR